MYKEFIGNIKSWKCPEQVLKQFRKALKRYETVMNKYRQSTDIVLNKYWNSPVKVLEKSQKSIGQDMNKSWTSLEQVLKAYWEGREKSWTSLKTPEQVLNKSRKAPEQVMKKMPLITFLIGSYISYIFPSSWRNLVIPIADWKAT